MAKAKRPTWWKMFSHQRAAVESVSDESAGSGLKAAFRYFDGEEIDPGDLSPQAFTIFCVIRPYIDESRRDYEEAVAKGKEGAEKRWEGSTTIGSLIAPLWGPYVYPMAPHSPPIVPHGVP